MNIEISLNSKSLQERISQLERTIPAKVDNALFATAQYGQQIILDRTQKGRGIFGAFPAYSPKYALFRRKQGRGTQVDLNFTGQMLSSMTARKNRGYAVIGFTRSTEAKKAYFNHQSRPFFGFNHLERNKLVTFFAKRLSL